MPDALPAFATASFAAKAVLLAVRNVIAVHRTISSALFF
jgi:hypothetical protein